jgi:hypothetical protein
MQQKKCMVRVPRARCSQTQVVLNQYYKESDQVFGALTEFI